MRARAATSGALACVAALGAITAFVFTQNVHCRDALAAAEALHHAVLVVDERGDDIRLAESQGDYDAATLAQQRQQLAMQTATDAQNTYRKARASCPK